MRWLSIKEIYKYGCLSCADKVTDKKKRYCPHEFCPYVDVFEEFDCYADFVEQTEKQTNGILRDLFMNA